VFGDEAEIGRSQPNERRRHASYPSNYLREVLLCINAAKEQNSSLILGSKWDTLLYDTLF
jgi:hypothetical protein